MWDVAIVGAGPAGATAAYHLSKNGHKVLLLDKKIFPRDKVCGDGLIPDTLSCLDRMNLLSKVESEGHRVHSIQVFSPSGIECEIPGNFITLKRYIFDALIVQHAIAQGANLIQVSVSDIEFLSDRVILKTTQGDIIARVCLLATGARIELAQKLGLITQQRANAVAIRCYIRSSSPIDKLILSFDRCILPGYAWIFPMGNQEFNVGYGIFGEKKFLVNINLLELFHTFIDRFSLASELLKNGEIISSIKGAMLRCGLTGTKLTVSGNLLAIGETIGTTFPFTGEGIGKAMESAEVASGVVDGYLRTGSVLALESYQNLMMQKLRPKYLGYEIAEKWLTKPFVLDFITRRVQKSKFLQESLGGIVNETTDPREIFSLKGLVRSLVS